MLARKNRLPVSAFSQPSRALRTKYFTLKIHRKDSNLENRVGIIVSKRVDKRAVVRNAAKRRIYESVYGLLPLMEKGYDMLFMVNKDFITLSQEEALREIKQALISEKLYIQ